jgi:hypothetical protein
MKHWTRLAMVVVLAALAFGGSFTCHASTNDDPAKPRPVAPAGK